MPEHLDPSELGTKQYWDAAYTRELSNHASDPSDVGTIWFSDASAEERVLSFLEQLSDESHLAKDSEEEAPGSQKPTSFVDVGTGNGHMLFVLREEGWQGRMVGIDYSTEAVRLAKEIQENSKSSRGEISLEDTADVEFERWDAINEEPGAWLPQEGFDVVLDKGTFDAISLSEEVDQQGRRICEGYRDKIERLAKPGGRVLVTSCNWTSDELKEWFAKGNLEVERQVKYPSFRFGGKEGSKICTVCFRKKDG